MGQGNAIAHLMPPPFYAHRMVVATARAPEESIQDQIDKIRDATALTRYKVEVMPGIYDEAITMKAYVDVVAPYGKVLIQPPSGTINCVTMTDNCMLQGVEISLTNAGPNATGVRTVNVDHVIIEDCWVTDGEGGDIGMNVTNTGTDIIVRKCRIDEVATGFFKDGTGTLWLADCRITAFAGGIDIDINDGTLNLMDNELMCTGAWANVDVGVSYDHVTTVNSFGNTLNGDGWQIADSANAKVYSHNDKFTKVTRAGTPPSGFMVATEEPQTYRVHNGMAIGDALTAIAALAEGPTETRRFTIQVFSGEYNEAITMARWVDLVGESNQSVVIYQPSATVITANNNSRVKNIRVELTGATATAAISCGEGFYGYFEEVVVKVTHTDGAASACIASSSTGGFEVHDCYLEIDDAADYPLYIAGSGNHFVYDSELVNTGTNGYGVFVGSALSLNSFDNKLRSDNGFYLTSHANTYVLSYGDDFTTVAWSGTSGVFADLTGARLYTCAAGVKVGEWVYVNADDSVAEADADALATMPSIGVVVWKPGMPAADTGLTCYVKNYGYYYDANANSGHGDPFVNGEEYWISATPGWITTTMHPVWPQRAGVAVSTQRFKILVGDNLGLVHCNEYLTTHGHVTVDQWVYITAVNDYVDPAKADAAATMPAIGVCVAILVTGDGGTPDTLLIKLRGKYSQAKPAGADGLGPFNASDDIYIDPATAGGITSLIPVGDIVQKVAEVKSCDGTLIYEIAD